jgi:hypothetical protein
VCSKLCGKLSAKTGAGENECNMYSVWGHNLDPVVE